MAKYEKGRRCLVLKSIVRPDIVGKQVVLRYWYPDCWDLLTESVIKQDCWDTTPPIEEIGFEAPVVFPEVWLLPIDDDNINKELRDELLESKPKELVQA